MPINLQYACYGIVVLLLLGTITIVIKHRVRPTSDDTELFLCIRSWWLMAGLFLFSILIIPELAIILFAVISFLSFQEYARVIKDASVNRGVLCLAFVVILLQYICVWQGWFSVFITLIPVFVFLFLPVSILIGGQPQDFLKNLAMLYWGLMTTVFLLSHAAYLMVLPVSVNPITGGAGLLFFLVFLTQFNDVMQYVWGKSIGGIKIVPTISPNKTVAGLVGGLAVTIPLSWLLAPYLTPFTQIQSLAIGLIIGLGGFVGDVVISAIKRDKGIKNMGPLIPGHGGVLDRVDSLTYTAPLFFYFVCYFYY